MFRTIAFTHLFATLVLSAPVSDSAPFKKTFDKDAELESLERRSFFDSSEAVVGAEPVILSELSGIEFVKRDAEAIGAEAEGLDLEQNCCCCPRNRKNNRNNGGYTTVCQTITRTVYCSPTYVTYDPCQTGSSGRGCCLECLCPSNWCGLCGGCSCCGDCCCGSSNNYCPPPPQSCAPAPAPSCPGSTTTPTTTITLPPVVHTTTVHITTTGAPAAAAAVEVTGAPVHLARRDCNESSSTISAVPTQVCTPICSPIYDPNCDPNCNPNYCDPNCNNGNSCCCGSGDCCRCFEWLCPSWWCDKLSCCCDGHRNNCNNCNNCNCQCQQPPAYQTQCQPPQVQPQPTPVC